MTWAPGWTERAIYLRCIRSYIYEWDWETKGCLYTAMSHRTSQLDKCDHYQNNRFFSAITDPQNGYVVFLSKHSFRQIFACINGREWDINIVTADIIFVMNIYQKQGKSEGFDSLVFLYFTHILHYFTGSGVIIWHTIVSETKKEEYGHIDNMNPQTKLKYSPNQNKKSTLKW